MCQVLELGFSSQLKHFVSNFIVILHTAWKIIRQYDIRAVFASTGQPTFDIKCSQ